MQSGSDITKLVKTLRSGSVAIFPTDTVYGIGCRIDFEKSVQQIYAIKNRGLNQPMPILLSDKSWLKRYCDEISPSIQKLIDHFWPGPLTIVLSVKHNSVLPMFLNENGKASFRVPRSEILCQVIRDLGVPIVGTSANFHAHPSPKNFGDIDSALMKMVEYVYIGQVGGGVESSVVEVTGTDLIIHREGAIHESQLRSVIGV